MGKVTLALLVLAIALGVYWFWWSDQGANNPITVEGTFSMTGLSGLTQMMGLPDMSGTPGMQGPVNGDFTLQAVPNKVRVARNMQGKRLSAIIRLDKRELYILDEKKKVYASEEFDFVDMSETERQEAEDTWAKELKRTADWDYIGTGEEKWFCNKQTPTNLPKGQPVKVEVWFTPDTRLGRRYFSTLNKLARVRLVGAAKQWEMFNIGNLQKMVDLQKEKGEKRSQWKYVNLDFFPIPMKADLSFGPMRLKMDVKNLSREKISKEVFEIPSNYNKVNINEILSYGGSNPGRTSPPGYNSQGRETPRFVVPPKQEPRRIIQTTTRRTTTRRSGRTSGST